MSVKADFNSHKFVQSSKNLNTHNFKQQPPNERKPNNQLFLATLLYGMVLFYATNIGQSYALHKHASILYLGHREEQRKGERERERERERKRKRARCRLQLKVIRVKFWALKCRGKYEALSNTTAGTREISEFYNNIVLNVGEI